MSGVLVALALLGAGRPAAAKPVRTEGGAITYLTRVRAFLNRGQSEGVAVGAVLHLTREGRAGPSCTVDAVTAHAATCTGKNLQVGDVFKVERPAPPAATTAAELPPVPSAAELGRRQSALNARPLPKVEFTTSVVSSAPVDLGGTVFASLEHEFWTALTHSDTQMQAERLDVGVRGLDISHGLRLWVDATLLQFVERPAGARLPYPSNTAILVRQTEVERRGNGDTLVGAVGRILPSSAPGATVVDGLQVGWRNADASLEVGGYAGAMPDPITLAPSFQRFTAGAYGAIRWVGDKETLVQLFQESFRLAVINEPELATRGELETAAQAYFSHSTSLAADVRFGAGGQNAPGLLEGVRLDFDSQPQAGLHLGASLRYLDYPTGDVLPLGALTPSRNSYHADATFSFAATSSVTVSGLLGATHDTLSSLEHGEVGPELALPRLFGELGGAAVGYYQEFGWWGQRNLFLQTMFQPLPRLKLVQRLSYFEDTPAAGAGDINTKEMALMLDGQLGLTSWLLAHVGFTFRSGFGNVLSGESAPIRDVSSSGMTFTAGLQGAL